MNTDNNPDEQQLAFEFLNKIIDLTETAFAIQSIQKLLIFFREKFNGMPAEKYAEQLTNKLIDKIPGIIERLKIENLR